MPRHRAGAKPTEAYMAHMGLWDLRDDGTGTLRPEPTGLEREYADLAAGDSKPGDLDEEAVARAR